MTSLVILKTFAKAWKSAIAVSDRFSATTWNALLLASILLLSVSVYAFCTLVKAGMPIGYQIAASDQTTSQSYSPDGVRARREYRATVSHEWALADRPQSESYRTGDVSDVSGLSANTSYHYRAKLKNAAGYLAASGDFTFATSAALPRAGGTFVDPTFGATISITDISITDSDERASTTQASDQQAPPTISADTKWTPPRNLVFWILVLNAVTTAFSTLIAALVAISTSILAWIANYRSQADHILKRTEAAIRVRELELKRQEMELKQREMALKEADFQLKVRQVELASAKPQQEVVPA